MDKKVLIFPGIFVLVGIIVMSVGVYIYATRDKYDCTTTAVITDIVETWNGGEDGYSYSVYINYEANGETFRHVSYPEYSSWMDVGDRIEIRYRSDNPKKIRNANIAHTVGLLMGLGALFSGIGVVLSILMMRTPKEKQSVPQDTPDLS